MKDKQPRLIEAFLVILLLCLLVIYGPAIISKYWGQKPANVFFIISLLSMGAAFFYYTVWPTIKEIKKNG
jgi:hypothetical protein